MRTGEFLTCTNFVIGKQINRIEKKTGQGKYKKKNKYSVALRLTLTKKIFVNKFQYY